MRIIASKVMDNSSRVAANTIILYARLIICALIGLYSVRIILAALGAEDYGIYNVVAGVIAMLAFIRTTLSATSIRFISVNQGTQDAVKVRDAFRKCFHLHLIMGLLISMVLAVAGLFLFDGFLNIPENRVHSAKLVFYFMCFTVFLNIVVTPFSALIISHEKFIYTSIISVLDAVLKLCIAFYITYTSHDKLVVYGLLMALVTVVNFFLYLFYDAKHYRNEMAVGKFSVKGLGEVTQFAGWTMLVTLGFTLSRQGFIILLNKFCGLIVNAAYALAGQVEGYLEMISSAVVTAIKPQIMKSYGEGDLDRMFRLSFTSGKIGVSMMSLLALPMIVLMPDILALWLKDIPEGTVLFARLIVVACMANQLTVGVSNANSAIGNIKVFSIVVSVSRALSLPVAWIFLRLGYSAYVAVGIYAIFEVITSLCRVIVLVRQNGLDYKLFFRDVFFRMSPPILVSLLVGVILARFVHHNLLWICIIAVTMLVVYIALMYLMGLSKYEKDIINGMIGKYKLRFKK